MNRTTHATDGAQAGLAQLDWAGRAVQIEYQWVNRDAAGPVMVFLHEGLGSVSMWRDFPTQLCQALGCRGLVYSRPGYGQSTPRAADEVWSPDFMHRQALDVLPAFLNAVGVREPVWLFGHSDGGSIALICASRYSIGAQPTGRSVLADASLADRHESPGGPGSYGYADISCPVGARPSGRSVATEAPLVAGAIVLAPHILVEDVSVSSIAQAKVAYETTDLRQKLAKHHADPDSAFWGWNRIWLDPDFRHWSLEDEIATIACPLLAVQGLDDEYGTLEQIRGIARRVPHTELLELPACGHSPHRDQTATLIMRATEFFKRHTTHPLPS